MLEPQKSPTPPAPAACTNTHHSRAAKEQRGARFCKANAARTVNEASQSNDWRLEEYRVSWALAHFHPPVWLMSYSLTFLVNSKTPPNPHPTLP